MFIVSNVRNIEVHQTSFVGKHENDVTLILNCVILLMPGDLPLCIYQDHNFMVHLNCTAMKNSLFVLAIILVIAWIIGFYSTNIGDIIHILLVMAVIALVVRVVKDDDLLERIKLKLK